jgi:thioredoxin-dependent peroxiredoxin
MASDSPSPAPALKIGQAAADFELSDSTGTRRRLSELAAAGPLVLLFYRGHW